MTTYITEGLDYEDMEGQIEPTLSVDEYAAKMGKDKDIITLSFTVNSEQAGKDVVNWFERGYDWVLDASLSEGEIEVGKYLVFVEMNRRSSGPRRIVELLTDLKTLTGLKPSNWIITIDGEEYDADENVLHQIMILNPNEYKAEADEEEEKLNEMRKSAGLEPKLIYTTGSPDTLLKDYVSKAGL